MAQIYGELIRAQLQSATSGTIGAAVPGLVYFNSDDKKLTLNDGTSWQKLVTEAALSGSASLLPIVTLDKGGLGANASAWSGLVRIESGVASAGQIGLNDIPDEEITYQKLNLLDGDIPQAKIADLATDLGGKVEANTSIVPATKTKITYDFKGLVTAGADLVSADIPATLLSKVVSSTPAMTGALTLPVGTTADRSGLSTQGMVRYNTTLATFEGHNGTDWGSIGGGGSAGGTVVTVPQVAHGLSIGNAVYLNGSTYAKAIATSAAAAEVVGVVSKADLPDEFDLTLSGELTGLTGLTTGEVYFLDATTPGLLVTTEPTVIGQVSVPVGVASSTSSMYVAPKRGAVVGGVNARTEVALTSGAVTNVQSVAGMTAGDLSGWVFISSAAPKRFYISAKFALSGAGGDYNLSYQTSGDTPPAGFLVDITTSGMIRVTLPAASGSTSVINYALNAPAIGASFPLSIDAGNITTGTFTRGTFNSGVEIKTGTLEVGLGRSSDGAAYVDLISQASESDFNARLIRYSGISGDLELNNSSGLVKFSITGVTKASVNSIGNFALDGLTHGSSYGCLTAKGIQGRQGTSGSSAGNPYNFFWSGSVLQAWVDGTNIGNVTISSDYRAKKNIETQNLTAIDRVMALRPVKYEFADYKELFKADGVEREGFIAHEVAAVIPSAVDGEKDAEDQVQSLKLDALVSVLTKAIQELKTELDLVKSELEALKNK